MKRIYLIAVILFSAGVFHACEDFLEQQPIGLLGESLLSNKEGVNSLLIGAYSGLNGIPYFHTFPTVSDQPLWGSIHGGECFKGTDALDQVTMLELSQYNITTGNNQVEMFWIDFFDFINKCNQTLAVLKQVTDMSEDEKVEVEAEARFLRGHFFFYLKRAFGNIPWIDETDLDYRVPNTDENGDYINAWPQIAADFDFARKNLPETQVDLGRPNKWAADIYYAKVLIYRACDGEYTNGFTEALSILTNAIENGVTINGLPYDLLQNYHDNFDAEYENGAESCWAVQHSVYDGTPTLYDRSIGYTPVPNGDGKSIWVTSQSTGSPGGGRGIGFFQPTPWYADHFRTDADGLPYLDMYSTNPNRLKDDYGLDPAPAPPTPDPFIPDTMGVDPRLDWTISRRGIPCLDYGDFPGKSWIRSQDHGGPYMSKKWYIWKYQEGIYDTDSRFPNNAINHVVIRFSDVLLLAAECEARVGSLDKARAYVNQIRQRMVDNSTSSRHWVKEDDGVTDAANYRIGVYPIGGPNDPFQDKATALDAILFERTLELGTEGERFFDVVRFGKGEEIFNEFIATESVRFDYLSEAEYTEVPDRYLPIPRSAIDLSQKEGLPTLKQNPGY